MKFIYALFATILLLGNSAYGNLLQDVDQEIIKIEKDLQNLINAGWLGSILGNTIGYLKDTLNDLEGAECIINAVIQIDESVIAIPSELQNCGISLSQDYVYVENAIKDIESAASNVKTVMQQKCATLEDIKSKDCFESAFSKIIELIKQAKLMLQAVQSVPVSEECILHAINNLVSVLEQLPNSIETCAKDF